MRSTETSLSRQSADDLELLGMAREREGEDHVLDVEIVDHGREHCRASVRTAATADHRQRRLVVELKRVVIEERDRSQAELGPCLEPLGDLAADTTGADD